MNLLSKTIFRKNLGAILLLLLGSVIRLIAAISFLPRGDGYAWLNLARYFSRVGELPIPEIYYAQIGNTLVFHHGPVSFILASVFYFVFNIFGQGEFGLVFTPYVFSISNLIMGYLLIEKLHGKRVAIWSLFILALIPIDLASIMITPTKTIASFFVTLSLYFYVISEQKRFKFIFFSGIFGGLAALTAYHPFILPAIILSMSLLQYLKDKEVKLIEISILYVIGFAITSSWLLIRNLISGGSFIYFGETRPMHFNYVFLPTLFSYTMWYHAFVWFWLGRPVDLNVFISKASLLIPHVQYFIGLWFILMTFLSVFSMASVYCYLKDSEKRKLVIFCLIWILIMLFLWHLLIFPYYRVPTVRLRELEPFITVLVIFPGKLLEKLYSAIKSNTTLVLIKWNLNQIILKIVVMLILFCQVTAISAALLENYHHKIQAAPFLNGYKWGRENLPEDTIILVSGYTYFYAWYLDRPIITFDLHPNLPRLTDISGKDAKFIATYLSQWSTDYIWTEERGDSRFPEWFLEVIDESDYFVLIHSNENYNLKVFEISI